MKTLYYDNNIPIYDKLDTQTVNLYARNFYYLDKECSEKYISDYDDIGIYYNYRIKVIRILQYIDFPLIIVYIVFFIILSKNNKLTFLVISSIISIYEVSMYIASICLIYGKELNFWCSEDVKNSKNDYIFQDGFHLKILDTVFFILNLVFNFINLISNILYYCSNGI